MLQKAKRNYLVLTFAIVLLLCSFAFAQNRRVRQSEVQTSFGVEEPVKRPVRLPRDILRQLVNENAERLRNCLETDSGTEADLPEYFVASTININNDGQPDLVIQAGKYCLQGAHNTAFWIFTKADQEVTPGYQLIFSRNTDWLDVLKTSTNGYRDVQTAGHTAIEIFSTVWKFDGSKYQPRVCKVENLQTHKVVHVKCSEE